MKPSNPFRPGRALALALLLLAAPLTIYLAHRAGGRVYYVAALLLIAYTFGATLLALERRGLQARELALLAALCALAVASRTLFIALPHFKPMVAIVMISGMALGPQAGFLVGAVSGFASNFIFGQGPWTPWQMFAFGVAGLLAGALRRTPLLQKRMPRALFGFFALVLVVGPLLDIYALFSMSAQLTPAAAAAVFGAGLPVNCIHGLAVALTLFLFGDPLLAQLGRICRKYGLLEGGGHGI